MARFNAVTAIWLRGRAHDLRIHDPRCDHRLASRGAAKSHGEAEMKRMKRDKPCSVDGCEDRVLARGLCNKHYCRMRAHGDTDRCYRPRSRNGEPLKFLLRAAGQSSDECLIWPFARDKNGYARIRHDGDNVVASNLLCTMVHGSPGTSGYQAAHSCGNGHLGCVNPRHLRWATCRENQKDKLKHGTQQRGERCWNARLNKNQVLVIRRLVKVTNIQFAAAVFDVSDSSVRSIVRGKTWAWL